MISGSFVKRTYIAWYGFRILSSKNKSRLPGMTSGSFVSRKYMPGMILGSFTISKYVALYYYRIL